MDAQKEALCRIINTLSNKNEELRNFMESIDNSLTGLKVESSKVLSELQRELEQLSSALDEKGAELRSIIEEESRRKEAELQKQLTEGKSALLSCQELLEFANQTLTVGDEDEFLKAAKQIKERVTMAPAFRLATRQVVSENMSQFTVDFSAERAGLHKLHFLPVPRAPDIDISSCVACDNNITVAWQPSSDGDGERVEFYDVEFRKTNRDSSLRSTGESSWEKILDIREKNVTISGLKFDSRFVVVRVRAKNKMAAGEFSEPVVMETKGFNFVLDAATAHAELKVSGEVVTWEPQGVKGHNPSIKGKESKSSLHTASSPTCPEAPRRLPVKRQEPERLANDSPENLTQFWATRRCQLTVTTGKCAPWLTGSPSVWAWLTGRAWAATISWEKAAAPGVSVRANGCRRRSLQSTTTERRRWIGRCLSE